MRGRANRTRLAIVGIIGLLVVAWFMLVRFNVASSWGWRQPKPDAPIIDVPKVWRTDYASWALLIIGVLAAVIGLIWLLRQFSSSNRARTYGISHETDHGSTVLSTDALGRAIEEQIEEFPGVSSASVKFFGARVAPEMMVSTKSLSAHGLANWALDLMFDRRLRRSLSQTRFMSAPHASFTSMAPFPSRW